MTPAEWLVENRAVVFKAWLKAQKNTRATWNLLLELQPDAEETMAYQTFRLKSETMLLLMESQAAAGESEVTKVTDSRPPEFITDPETAVIMAIRASQDNISNGRIPTTFIMEAYNNLVPPAMRIEATQGVSKIIRQLTNGKAVFKLAKYNKVAQRCLFWNSAIMELLGKGNKSNNTSQEEPRLF